MRKAFLASVFLLSVLLGTASTAYAHFPATDGQMTAILHVDPNDDPSPGQPATLYFIFDDVTNRFQLAQCTCNLSISEQSKPLFFAPLVATTGSAASVYNAAVPYTFPRRDVYQITLTGQPTTPGVFQPFKLTWNFRVDQYSESSQSFSTRTFIILFLAILGSLLGVGAIIFWLEPVRKR